VEILASLPGVGRIVLATLLAEAWDGLRLKFLALRCEEMVNSFGISIAYG
jgi:hypothetical protein